MKVNDEQAWAQQASELTTTDEASQKFHDFLVSWVEQAEELLDAHQLDPREALVRAYGFTEQRLGFLSADWLGQMLLVIVQHWFSGDAVWETLSVWERRMVEQATALKLAELQEQAAQDTPESLV